MATKAKHERRKRALARFTIYQRDDHRPHTNIPRFHTVEQHLAYCARKITEKTALINAIRAVEPNAV